MSYQMSETGVKYRIINNKDTRNPKRKSSISVPAFVWSSDLTEANNTICGIDIAEFVIIGTSKHILWNAK